MDVIAKTRELGKSIQSDERYIRLLNAKKANDEDKELQKSISTFNQQRIDLNKEISKEEKDNDKLMQLDKEIKEQYELIMGNKNMIEFNNAKVEIDNMMKFINQILMGTMNGEDPDSIEEHQCNGSCSSCGSCE